MTEEQYDRVCRSRFDGIDGKFDSIENKLDSIKTILVGDGRNPGLADDVRELKAFKKTTIGAIALLVGTVVTQIAVWIRTHI